MKGVENFIEYCRKCLADHWEKFVQKTDTQITDFLGDDLRGIKSDIVDCLTSTTKSYHYVLPTQLVSKLVDHTLDCRSLQASYGKPGAFDARSIAHRVVVPFDSKNHNVLGGSNEPYVNNPLRCPAVTLDYEAKQKNKSDWKRLAEILLLVEQKDNLDFTEAVFNQVLAEIFRLLSNVHVVYPTPNRISLEKTVQIVETFLMESSGGDLLEVVTTALFREIAHRFGVFDKIRREKVNTSDHSSGMAGDIECYLNGQIVLLVEVKDKTINMVQLEAKLDTARAGKIREILFIADKGIERDQEPMLIQRVKAEFSSGQNIYFARVMDFAYSILILLGEEGRVGFIRQIGSELDSGNSAIFQKRKWAGLLREV
jgi:hypothetical protein